MLQITELVISQSLIKFIEQLVDEDGSVKDSAVGQYCIYIHQFGI